MPMAAPARPAMRLAGARASRAASGPRRSDRRRPRPRPRHLLLAVLVALLSTLGYLGALRASGNFHEVLPRELYRSAQVTPASLRGAREEMGIRSVINLRGAHPGAAWYDAEVGAARALGIAHFDFAMSDHAILAPGQAARLVALMRAAPKPLLIHCLAGSDRTGLGAALFLARIAGEDAEKAEGQLSIRYGHIAIPYLSSAYSMDESWERLEHPDPAPPGHAAAPVDKT